MYKITLFYDWSYRKDAHAKKYFLTIAAIVGMHVQC